MNSWKALLKQLIKVFIYFGIFTLFLTILYYFNVIDNKLCSYLRLIGFIIILYFNSNNLSRKINTNNFVNGLLLGLSIIFLFLIGALIIKYKINFKLIIYYILILGVSILGSIRKKKKKEKLKY